MDAFILQTKQLTKVFKNNGSDVFALRGVNLSISKGELVAVMGPSGSGKSTLLHILGGLDSPTSGEVHLDGQRIDRLSETQRAILRRKHVGFVFQAFNLIGNLSVKDNVELPALIQGRSNQQASQQRTALLEQLGIANKAFNAPNQLSGGEKQRAAMARALVNQPAILLADEPTGNLDSKSAMDVLTMLRQTHHNGQTILVVTHDPNVASIAQRVIVMKDGQITSETVLETRQDARQLFTNMLDMEM